MFSVFSLSLFFFGQLAQLKCINTMWRRTYQEWRENIKKAPAKVFDHDTNKKKQ